MFFLGFGKAEASCEMGCDGIWGKILNKCIEEPAKDDVKAQTDIVAGLKADAPNLILLPWNLSLGVEGGKDLYETNWDEGWFIYAKITYSGTLLNLSK